jgi:hypothetical protein
MMFDNLDDMQAEAEQYRLRLEADRVTAEWRAPLTTLTAHRSIKTLPLFDDGSEEQREMFE